MLRQVTPGPWGMAVLSPSPTRCLPFFFFTLLSFPSSILPPTLPSLWQHPNESFQTIITILEGMENCPWILDSNKCSLEAASYQGDTNWVLKRLRVQLSCWKMRSECTFSPDQPRWPSPTSCKVARMGHRQLLISSLGPQGRNDRLQAEPTALCSGEMGGSLEFLGHISAAFHCLVPSTTRYMEVCQPVSSRNPTPKSSTRVGHYRTVAPPAAADSSWVPLGTCARSQLCPGLPRTQYS